LFLAKFNSNLVLTAVIFTKKAMHKLPFCLILLVLAKPVFTQKSISANFATIPLFREGKRDLMAEINYEFFDTKRKMVRFGFGFGFKNQKEKTETATETNEFWEKYAGVAILAGAKFYLTSKTNHGFYAGLLCQFGFVKEESRRRRITTNIGSWHGSDNLSWLFKMGPTIGITFMANKHWSLEPEIGFLLGDKKELIWPEKVPPPPFIKRLHLAFNIGYRFPKRQ